MTTDDETMRLLEPAVTCAHFEAKQGCVHYRDTQTTASLEEHLDWNCRH